MHAPRVNGGRLVLDEPTDRPEGAEVEPCAIDDDDCDSEDRARLLEAIEQGAEIIERDDLVDGLELADELLARGEARAR